MRTTTNPRPPPTFFPPQGTSLKLFATGATVGPVVDSLHNQCLLEYDVLPISIASMDGQGYAFASSWLIPPLLGIAYVVLGGVLPRIGQAFVDASTGGAFSMQEVAPPAAESESCHAAKQYILKDKALLAVATTALIIKLSEFLQTHDDLELLGATVGANEKLGCMAIAALSQWAVLDRTPAALLAAAITSVGGPLSELPFVAAGCWTYIPEASDYMPLANLQLQSGGLLDNVATSFLGMDYRDLALSSITGPCYFAVTMDAIALGRWFDSFSSEDNGI